ncbi:M3 family oligoendopeptidase [Marininema halotolerans]|uniref:Oligoendopeptidase, pepF/M3 family n=1 Tax=Marininema halotolerans TaxID=1155944 RepID=A0A1I6RFJ5_9BACL|nr:M3 family oligoendopeptidase [Marininema halotolerans]SFS63434.1 oligoendopeptidase, pepF/M3 family [Marininema halotolerans]
MAKHQQELRLTWDLECFFPGGSASPQYEEYLNTIEASLSVLNAQIDEQAGTPTEDLSKWDEMLQQSQRIASQLWEAIAFVECLAAQDTTDKGVPILYGRNKQLGAAFNSTLTKLDQLILQMDDDRWSALLQDERFAEVSFNLAERRLRAKEKMSSEGESLAGDLAVDGYHAWGNIYNSLEGRLTVPFEENGEIKELSIGQADNKLYHPERGVRQRTFAAIEKAWEKEEDLVAAALNHLAGFRINLYRHRGWDSILKEPLNINRMSEKTLKTMWEVIDQNKAKLLQFFDRKAKLLGVEKLAWYDLYAPVGREEGKEISYDEAAHFITEQFHRFDPRLATFAEKAYQEGWIEAEDRAGKLPGGFCTTFSDSEQSRIFLTYSGTMSNVATIAHELGHAYHDEMMNGQPHMVKEYAMNVAETASTFAERIVSDAAIREAQSTQEKITLLEDKIQAAVAFFMDIQCRFLFETRFYEERKKGLVSVNRLNELMLEAQKEAFMDSLAEYHPRFWASKRHFYGTEAPFYNFPYTFGYLFSTGIYSKALEEGPSFADQYVELLRDTGRMTTEDLAQKHLGVDLTRPEFWQNAVNLIHQDIDQFLTLTS